ncbi:cytochrome c family protein [Kiloniella laminariae]|uniref:Cytochrome c family protein n=1 Tax=Kiloniella laminariae TaxID=454162 RepID=A0ABT4LHT6_9PROT|nr:cytochrome c family protein [Kiloniella laminariae]MCZ4280661.1 cytochrome c family protein [Kiloniella laminariae]
MARIATTLWGIALGLSFTVSAAAAADVAAGKKVFNKCKACHAIGKSKIGPDLAGIINRPAASIEGFKYSDPMQNSGLTWTEENLATFLKKPKALVPGTRMAFAGLKKDDDIQNLIAYLKEATVP